MTKSISDDAAASPMSLEPLLPCSVYVYHTLQVTPRFSKQNHRSLLYLVVDALTQQRPHKEWHTSHPHMHRIFASIVVPHRSRLCETACHLDVLYCHFCLAHSVRNLG